MLRRTVSSTGVVYYFSPLLRDRGVPHAFSTRIGGLSPAPFDSMNLGNPNGYPVQDDYERVWANYRILADACGCGGRELTRVHQVHGRAVARVAAGRAFDVSIKADALVSDDPARMVSVRVADCCPILLADDDGRHVAAVHAGWRGLIAGVVAATVAELKTRTNTPLVAAVGPCIGFDAFEVGPEVLAEFEAAFGSAAPIRRRTNGKGHADLRRAVWLQLRAAGFAEDRIDTTDRCTHRDRAEFFSHRRDNGQTGRMAAIAAAKGERLAASSRRMTTSASSMASRGVASDFGKPTFSGATSRPAHSLFPHLG